MNLTRSASAILAFALCLACNNAAQKPIVASAADQTTYAVRYPDALGASRERFAEQESRATRLTGELGKFTSDVDAKNWSHVVEAYKLSDSAGKGAAYADGYEQNDNINTFFVEQKDKLNQSIAGNVAYAAKQNDCREPGSIAGTATTAVNKAVEKQMKERLRGDNEAQAYVEAHAEAIGQKSVEKVRDQVDTLTELSYTVNVGLERTRRQLQSQLDEASKVRNTLETAAKNADEQAQDATQPDGDRKAAKTRAEAARASASRIESEQQQAKSVLDETEKRINKVRTDYQTAFDALIKSAEEKAAAAPAPTKK
jgi:hypothetical protein